MNIHLADLEAVLSLMIDVVKVVECHCGLSAYFVGLENMGNTFKRNRERTLKQKLIRTIG